MFVSLCTSYDFLAQALRLEDDVSIYLSDAKASALMMMMMIMIQVIILAWSCCRGPAKVKSSAWAHSLLQTIVACALYGQTA